MRVEAKAEGEIYITLDEVFDFKKVEEFRRCYEQVDTSKVKDVAINFSFTRYMDSSALGMLLNVQSHFKTKSIGVRIINVNDQIKKILAISRFDQRFSIQ